jgi:hypothetical protein
MTASAAEIPSSVGEKRCPRCGSPVPSSKLSGMQRIWCSDRCRHLAAQNSFDRRSAGRTMPQTHYELESESAHWWLAGQDLTSGVTRADDRIQ